MRTTQVSCVHCARCGFTSEDLALITCQCGEGEIVVTRRRGSRLAVALHWVIVALAIVIVAVAL